MDNDCHVIRKCESALLVPSGSPEDCYTVSVRVRVRAKSPKGTGSSLCKNPTAWLGTCAPFYTFPQCNSNNATPWRLFGSHHLSDTLVSVSADIHALETLYKLANTNNQKRMYVRWLLMRSMWRTIATTVETERLRCRYRSFMALGKSGCSPDLADLRRTIPVPLSAVIVRLYLKQRTCEIQLKARKVRMTDKTQRRDYSVESRS